AAGRTPKSGPHPLQSSRSSSRREADRAANRAAGKTPKNGRLCIKQEVPEQEEEP
ncbi:unnamed protein product, partial [Closterium sp. NIES-53]